jgi:hypothetical protein
VLLEGLVGQEVLTGPEKPDPLDEVGRALVEGIRHADSVVPANKG